MKKYYKNYRRRGNASFFLIIGAVFLAVGVLSVFFWNLAAAVVCIVAGALLAVLPQFVIFSRYGLEGGVLHYRRAGLPRKIKCSEAGAAVICIYDEYRRWKGFVPAVFPGKDGQVTVPAFVLLKEADENELDLCDTRTNAKITFRRSYITDMMLDFDFLEQFRDSGFAGKIYISEYIYALYKPAFDRIFDGDERVSVYDRIPKNMKKFQK